MTEASAPVRSAAGALTAPPYALVTLSGAAVLGSQLLTMKSFSPWGMEQPMLIFLIATICLAGTLIPAAQRLPARARLAAQGCHERLLTAGQACARAGARPNHGGGSADAGQERSPAGRRDTPNKRIEQARRRLYGRLRSVSARSSCAGRYADLRRGH